MKRFSNFLVAVVLLCLLLSACVTREKPRPPPAKSDLPDSSRIHLIQKYLEQNKCGFLRGSKTSFNISGHMTAQTRPGSTIYLFTAPNVSFAAVMYVVANCMALNKATLVDGSSFNMGPWPPGTYVLMVHGNRFATGEQGFPVVKKFNQSNYTLKVAFMGGNPDYSVLSFSIKPQEG
jgi:hypothetical protein